MSCIMTLERINTSVIIASVPPKEKIALVIHFFNKARERSPDALAISTD